MLTERITAEHLAELYSDKYIQNVEHDDRPAYPVFHPLAQYLSAWSNNEFAGAFLVITQSKYELELHALLKKEFLSKSRELGKECIDWAFSNPEVLRVTAYVIEGLEMAKNYCLKIGFKLEGTRRKACKVNGEIKDVYVMGLIRDEWVLF